MTTPSTSPAHRAAGLLHARPLALRRDLIGASFAVLESRLAQQADPGLLARVARKVGLGGARPSAKAKSPLTALAQPGISRVFGMFDGSIVSGGVAIITIDGPLLDRALVFYDWYDGTPYVAVDGYDRIGHDLLEAHASADVASVLLRISSPGGLVSGCFDLCAKIAAAADAEGAKPVIAYLDDHAYSAGYAIACSGLAIIAPQLGSCGSIGVLAVHESYAGFYEAHGVVHTFIESHRLKSAADHAKPLDTEAEAMIKAHVDAAADVFVGHVAARREMDEASVDALEAGWFTAEAALENGLIDAIGTFDEVLAGLQADPAAFVATLFAPDETSDPGDGADPETAPSPQETAAMITKPNAAKKPSAVSAKGATQKPRSAASTEGHEDEELEEGAETDKEDTGAEGDDAETGDEPKKDEAAKIAASPLAAKHPGLALAAIQSKQSLKQFEANAKAVSGGGKNHLDSRMSGERRLGGDAKPPAKGAAQPINASAIFASRRKAAHG